MKKQTEADLIFDKLMKDGKMTAVVDYYLATDLSINRYQIYEEIVPQIAFGASWDIILKDYNEIFSLSTSEETPLMALYQITSLVRNRMDGIKNFLDPARSNDVLRFCSLFLNEKDEDKTQWSETSAKIKIENWTKAGIPMSVFFSLCPSLTPGLLKHFRNEISELAKRK